MTSVEPTAPIAPTAPVRRRRPPPIVTVIVGVVVAVALFAGGYVAAGGARSAGDDHPAMNARAAAVMPFDLTATVHTFTKDDRGGVEQVVVKNPADQRNLDLIHGHLQHEATEFARGNFADPATIHGADMPGLKKLQAAGGRLTVAYLELPTGARITYRGADVDAVAAIHEWFDAQTNDHTMPGMGG